MNDLVRLSSLFGRAAPAATPGAPATIPHPPPQIADLAVGTILRGVVVGEDGDGHVVVRTALGTVEVATRSHPPANSEVTLQIRSSGSQLQVLLMPGKPGTGARPVPVPVPPPTPAAASVPPSTGALPAHGGSATSAPSAPSPLSGSPAPAPPPAVGSGHAVAPDPLSLGQTVRAVVQAPAPIPAAAPSQAEVPSGLTAVLTRLSPGSEITLRVLSVAAPAAPLPSSGSGTASASAPTPTAPGTPTPAPTVTSTPNAPTQASPAGPPAPASATPAAPSSPVPQTAQPTPPAQTAATPPQTSAPTPSVTTPSPPVASPPGTPTVTPANTPAPTVSITQSQPAPTQGPPATIPTPAPAAPASPPSPSPVPQAAPAAAAETAAPAEAVRVSFSSPASVTTAPGAIRFPGVITAVTHSGHPLLQTPLGTLTLEVDAPLANGSRLALELPTGGLPPVQAGNGTRAAVPLALTAHDWPALEEAVQTLQSSGPAPGSALAALPQPGAKLASGILFFLSALNGGDVTRWLGERAVEALRAAGRDPLLTRLGQDFAQLGRWAEAAGGDWRAFLVPLYDGNHVHPLRLFLRDQKGRRGQSDGGDQERNATRFVLEVEMSRLGEMQLDGLVHAKRFDLILRTRQALPPVMRQDITKIFDDANEAAGTTGSVGFQASSDWQFLPIEGPTAAPPSLVV